MRIALDRRNIVGLVVITGLLLAIVAMSFESVMSIKAAGLGRRTIRQIIVDADATLALVVTAELAERSFQLTGDEADLAPYRAALPALGASVTTLSASAAIDPDRLRQVTAIRAMIAAKLEALSRSIERRRDGGLAEVLADHRSQQAQETTARL